MPRPSIDPEPHKLAIAAALRELERSIELLVQSLLHDAVLVSVPAAASDREARRRVCDAYATINYAPEQAVNDTVTCMGVVGAPAAAIARAEDVNNAKAKLRSVCTPLQNQRVRIAAKDGEGGRLVRSVPLVRVLLRELQRSDLNLIAAYRRLPILTGRPTRIAYVRAYTRVVRRKTRDAILDLLDRIDRQGVAADRTRIYRLPATERHLALVEERYENLRANITFHGLDARNRGRVMIAAELPLLYPVGRSKDLPEIRYPNPEEGAPMAARPRTGKLEDKPFLESLPVYRYRPAARRGEPRTQAR